MFYAFGEKASLRAGIKKSDFNDFFQEKLYHNEYNENITCKYCNCKLGPHIATFSFEKSFRTYAFVNSWLSAERMLDNTKRWVFIGYSLPDADYEFKHLLKTCQLKDEKDKEIHVVVAHDDIAIEQYSSLFGPSNINIFPTALEGYVDWLNGNC